MTFLSIRLYIISLIFFLGCSAENKIPEEEEVVGYENNVVIPLGGNAYSISDGEKLVIGEEGIESWTNTEKKLAIYFYSAEESNCNLTIPIETNQNTIRYSVSLNDDFFEIEVLPNKSEINLGIHSLKKGYNIVILKGLITTDAFPKLTNLSIYSNELLSLNYIKENSSKRFYWGRRGPSAVSYTHLRAHET